MNINPIRRPMIGIVICFMAGTWLGLSLDGPLLPLLCAAEICLVFALLSRSPIRRFAIHAVVILAAWLSAGLRTEDVLRMKYDGSHLSDTGKLEIIGVVSNDPGARPMPSSSGQARSFLLNMEQARQETGVLQNAEGKLRVIYYYNSKWSRLPRYGERWVFKGEIHKSSSLSRRSKHNVLLTSAGKSRFMTDRQGCGIVALCYEARRAAADILASGINDYPDAVALFHALMLGYREHLPREAIAAFKFTGTFHIFAISGLHVGIICLLIRFLLKAFRISRVYWVLFLAPFIIAYTLATGARPSAVRACIMAIIFFLAPLVGRKADIPSGLAVAAVIILAWAPNQLLDVGFIYSFVVVTGIVVFCPLFDQLFRKLWQPDPFRVEAEAKRVIWLRSTVRHICGLAAVSCSAWLTSAPLTSYYFGCFTPVALIGNLLVVPLAFLIVTTGCLSILLGSCITLFADIFNHAALALVTALLRSTEFMAGLPGGRWETGRISVCGMLCWYGLLATGYLCVRGVSLRGNDVTRIEL